MFTPAGDFISLERSPLLEFPNVEEIQAERKTIRYFGLYTSVIHVDGLISL